MNKPIKPLVSVVLGSYNRVSFLKLTIDSIRKELKETPHELFVVDGGSTDDSIKWLVKQKDIITIVQHNRGEWHGQKIEKKSWGYFMNLAFKSAHGKYIFMLSDDCLIIPSAVTKGIQYFDKKLSQGENLGALSFWWRHWPYQKRFGIHKFYNILNVNHGLYLTKALIDVGFVDETTYTFYSGDVDLAYKMRHQGYTILDSPDSYIEHYGHANLSLIASNWQTHREDNKQLVDKWVDIFKDVDFSPENRWHRVEKEFIDPTNTARRFWRLHVLNFLNYKYYLKNIRNYFEKNEQKAV